MSDFLRAHLDVLCVVTGCGVVVLLGALFMPRWLRGVRYSRRSSAHALNVRVDPVWGVDLDEHDADWDEILAGDDDPYATAPFAPDLSSDATIRKYQLEAWDTAGFPAIPRTVQAVTLPPLEEACTANTAPSEYDDATVAERPAPAGATPSSAPMRATGVIPYITPASELIPCPSDFPGPSDSPARDAGAERVPAVHAAGGDPSTDVKETASATVLDLREEDRDDHSDRSGRDGREAGSHPVDEGRLGHGRGLLHRVAARLARLTRPTRLPVAVTVPRAPQPLEGRIITGPPPPVLGYIDGLALTGTYYERIEQIGAQARVLALAAAA